MSPKESKSHWQTEPDTHSTSVLLLLCSPVDRPGVLVLKVLRVQEECSMRLVHCEHHQSPGEGHQHSRPVSEGSARTLVLFNRETAAQLSPAPGDIIHIYPPWWDSVSNIYYCIHHPLKKTHIWLIIVLDGRIFDDAKHVPDYPTHLCVNCMVS